MKAGLVTGQRRFELVDVPEPRPVAGQAVAEVALWASAGPRRGWSGPF